MNVNNNPDVTTLALLNLIRLLAAELVAGQHRDDVVKLIRSIDLKLNATPLPDGVEGDQAREGIARARELLRPYVKQLRAQAVAARARDREVSEAMSSPKPKFLQ